MGGKPTDTEIPEPANPETARSVRTDSPSATPRSRTVERHAGRRARDARSGPSLRAARQSGSRARGLARGGPEATVGFRRARHPAHAIAAIQEAKGDLEGAAKVVRAAASVTGFPLVASALADAARCWAETARASPRSPRIAA
jgi:hypothetical protein